MFEESLRARWKHIDETNMLKNKILKKIPKFGGLGRFSHIWAFWAKNSKFAIISVRDMFEESLRARGSILMIQICWKTKI